MHEGCIQESTPLPTRIIDVGPSDGSKEPCLCLPPVGTQDRYIALSYCWGLSPGITTTADTLSAHQSRIPLDQLPRTMKDAVLLTRRLGVRYLWIDALCIIQRRLNLARDEEAIEDWQREASRMASVYSGAWITIAAAEARDKADGILLPRPEEIRCEIPLSASPIASDKPVYARVPFSTKPAPLEKRAWTLQESLLPPRMVEFRKEQVSFICRSKMLWESGAEGKVPGAARMAEIKGPMFFSPWDKSSYYPTERDMYLRRWYVNIGAYTLRQITNEADRLPALSGLAHQMQPIIGGEYHAGLWKEDFINGLLWRCTVYGGSRLPPREIQYLRREKEYRAPTWSWASLSGEVYYEYYRESHWEKFEGPRWPTRVLEVCTSPVGPFFDPMGLVRAGFVRLRGPVRTGALVMNTDRKYKRKDGMARKAIHLLTDNEDDKEAAMKAPQYGGQNVVAVCLFDQGDEWPIKMSCVQLLPDRGLLLKQRQHSEDYERVGIFLLENPIWFEDCPTKELVVV